MLLDMESRDMAVGVNGLDGQSESEGEGVSAAAMRPRVHLPM